MVIRRRSRKKFNSSRAAWMDIAKKTGATPATHRIRKVKSPGNFAWNVTRK